MGKVVSHVEPISFLPFAAIGFAILFAIPTYARTQIDEEKIVDPFTRHIVLGIKSWSLMVMSVVYLIGVEIILLSCAEIIPQEFSIILNSYIHFSISSTGIIIGLFLVANSFVCFLLVFSLMLYPIKKWITNQIMKDYHL